jgi:hypothetical protein
MTQARFAFDFLGKSPTAGAALENSSAPLSAFL